MKNLKIKKLLISRAEYYVGDDSGNNLLMKIDYMNGVVELIAAGESKEGFRVMKREANKIAKDLIGRKRNVNFVKK